MEVLVAHREVWCVAGVQPVVASGAPLARRVTAAAAGAARPRRHTLHAARRRSPHVSHFTLTVIRLIIIINGAGAFMTDKELGTLSTHTIRIIGTIDVYYIYLTVF